MANPSIGSPLPPYAGIFTRWDAMLDSPSEDQLALKAEMVKLLAEQQPTSESDPELWWRLAQVTSNLTETLCEHHISHAEVDCKLGAEAKQYAEKALNLLGPKAGQHFEANLAMTLSTGHLATLAHAHEHTVTVKMSLLKTFCKHFEICARLKPDHWRVLMLRSQMALIMALHADEQDRHDLEEARTPYSLPEFLFAPLNLEQAIADLRRALERKQNYVHLYHILTVALNMAGKWAEAQQIVERCLAMPRYPGRVYEHIYKHMEKHLQDLRAKQQTGGNPAPPPPPTTAGGGTQQG